MSGTLKNMGDNDGFLTSSSLHLSTAYREQHVAEREAENTLFLSDFLTQSKGKARLGEVCYKKRH